MKTSPLSQALRKDNMEIVQVLLDAGARGEPEDVLSAARSGYPQYLRAVLDAGGEVPRCDGDSRKSPVWNELGGYGDDSDGEDVVACARLLEERGISLQDPAYARQPLHSAALFGRATLAAYLIERGCDVNERKSGKTPLMLNSHSEKIARLLLEHGADVNA
ncbi:MAG: ankyrin repeat domain-containing protein [Bacteroidaceae bacterium]|nr:ankyrin repeat domain-containing protein [Bacteroidaceae bacterium]